MHIFELGAVFQRRGDEDGHEPQSGDFGFSTGFLASFHIAAILRRQGVVPSFVGWINPMWRQDVIMIAILLVISSAFAILLAAGEFIG
jgi:amino acid transporter